MKLTDANLDYQDCRPGTPGRDPLDSKSLPDHVRKALEEARSRRRETDSAEQRETDSSER